MSARTFPQLIGQLRQVLGGLPDRRTGQNTRYSMEDIGASAFSIFFTQSPSFLSFQRSRQPAKGQNNAQSLFEVGHIPSDNPIRQTLDPVAPQRLFPIWPCARSL